MQAAVQLCELPLTLKYYIYLQVSYYIFEHSMYYIFDFLRIIKLGYVLKKVVFVLYIKDSYFSLLARHNRIMHRPVARTQTKTRRLVTMTTNPWTRLTLTLRSVTLSHEKIQGVELVTRNFNCRVASSDEYLLVVSLICRYSISVGEGGWGLQLLSSGLLTSS